MSDQNFDGTFFAEGVVVIILVVLLVFGSTDIEGLSATPTRD